MNKFYNSKFFNSPYLYLLIIVIYSFCINFYYGNLGVYPIDTFLHYDSAHRILKNEFPIKDYWIVSGFIIEFIQSSIFPISHWLRSLLKQLHPSNILYIIIT